jgi:hypothetical protein
MEEEAAHFLTGKKQRVRKGLGTKYSLQRHTSSHLLLPTRSHLLEFPLPSKIMPPAWDQTFNI